MSRYNPGSIGVTSSALLRIRQGISSGRLGFSVVELKDGERLDHIAHRAYGDGKLWWIIAAASGIGWWLQAPPGTRVIVPTDLGEL